MHHINHTTGFVLGHADIKEADRLFFLFTRELGMVTAIAQGIRKETSRLRYSLQDFSCSRIDLVHGKEMWRITSAKKIELDGFENFSYLIMFARVLNLVRRLCQGEEAVEPIFDILEQITKIFANEKDLSAQAGIPEKVLLGIEYIAVLKILHELGYVAIKNTVAVYVISELSLEKAGEAYEDRRDILAVITHALGETHL